MEPVTNFASPPPPPPHDDKGKEEATTTTTNRRPNTRDMTVRAVDDEMALLIQRTSLASLGISRVTSNSVGNGVRETEQRPIANGCTTHIVVSTDTLEGLAMKYGSSVAEIKKLNGLWSARDIYTRKTLVVPDRELHSLEERTEERRLKIEMFCQTTGATELKAESALMKRNWHLEQAVEDFFQAAEKERIATARAAVASPPRTDSLSLSYSSMEEELAQPAAFYDAVPVGSSKRDVIAEDFEGDL